MDLQCKAGKWGWAGGVRQGMLRKMWFGSCQLQSVRNKQFEMFCPT